MFLFMYEAIIGGFPLTATNLTTFFSHHWRFPLITVYNFFFFEKNYVFQTVFTVDSVYLNKVNFLYMVFGT